jgi:hypothetical protein
LAFCVCLALFIYVFIIYILKSVNYRPSAEDIINNNAFTPGQSQPSGWGPGRRLEDD